MGSGEAPLDTASELMGSKRDSGNDKLRSPPGSISTFSTPVSGMGGTDVNRTSVSSLSTALDDETSSAAPIDVHSMPADPVPPVISQSVRSGRRPRLIGLRGTPAGSAQDGAAAGPSSPLVPGSEPDVKTRPQERVTSPGFREGDLFCDDPAQTAAARSLGVSVLPPLR